MAEEEWYVDTLAELRERTPSQMIERVGVIIRETELDEEYSESAQLLLVIVGDLADRLAEEEKRHLESIKTYEGRVNAHRRQGDEWTAKARRWETAARGLARVLNETEDMY
jgi:hypothetical protein